MLTGPSFLSLSGVSIDISIEIGYVVVRTDLEIANGGAITGNRIDMEHVPSFKYG